MMACHERIRPIPAHRLALLLALALCSAAGGRAQAQAPSPMVQGYPILRAPKPAGEPVPASVVLPVMLDPFPSLHILLGTHFLDVSADDPHLRLEPSRGFSAGAVLGLDWVGELWRVGYLRRAYLHDLPEGTLFRGDEVDFLGIEANELWVHAGLRPARPLFLGLGLGLHQRRLRFTLKTPGALTARVLEETVLSQALLLEYALLPPFFIQARYARDFPGGRVELSGWTVLVAYTIPL